MLPSPLLLLVINDILLKISKDDKKIVGYEDVLVLVSGVTQSSLGMQFSWAKSKFYKNFWMGGVERDQ